MKHWTQAEFTVRRDEGTPCRLAVHPLRGADLRTLQPRAPWLARRAWRFTLGALAVFGAWLALSGCAEPIDCGGARAHTQEQLQAKQQACRAERYQ